MFLKFIDKYFYPLIIGLILISASSIVYNFLIEPALTKDKIEVSLSKFTKSETNNLLYYDDTVSPENIALYETALNEYSTLNKFLSEGELKIVVSERDIPDIAFELYKSKKKHPENIKGAYFKSYNLIIIKDFDIFKEINLKNIQTTQPREELIELNKSINVNVLYHEIGHCLMAKSDINSDTKKAFKTSFKEEKLLLFEKNNSYVCSDLEEFIAECISNYLMFGYVEYPNKDLEKNSTYSNKTIETFLKSFL